MTNYSGKFVSPISHAAANMPQEEKKDEKFVPVLPDSPNPDYATTVSMMDRVKALFGKLWWLWLIVIVLWLGKEN